MAELGVNFNPLLIFSLRRLAAECSERILVEAVRAGWLHLLSLAPRDFFLPGEQRIAFVGFHSCSQEWGDSGAIQPQARLKTELFRHAHLQIQESNNFIQFKPFLQFLCRKLKGKESALCLALPLILTFPSPSRPHQVNEWALS